MAFIERVIAALQAFRSPEQEKSFDSAIGQVFTHALDLVYPGERSLTRPYEQHPTVHAAVSAIASSISALPLEMFPAGDEEREEPNEDSIVLKLIEEGSPDKDGPQLIEGTVVSMKLYGDAFWFLDGEARRTATGPQFPTKVELWEPAMVSALVKDGAIVGWEYRPMSGGVTRVEKDKVLQFKSFNPYDRHRGLAPLQAAKIAASGGYKALQYQEAFLDNDATPYGLITPKEGQIVQPGEMTRLRDEMEARHRGSLKRGRLGALNTPIEFQQLGMTQKDMDFPMWLDAASAFILMVFKVPPSVAGLQKDANYNESIHQSRQFWYNHMPLVHYIERRIKVGLCKRYGIAEEPFFKTETIKAMIQDQTAVTEQARNLWNMGVPFEQINSRLELGFDTDYEAARTPWIAFSMVNANDQASLGADTGPDRTPLPGDTPAQPGDESTVADDPTEGKAVTRSELQRRMSWNTLIARIREEEQMFTSQVRQHLNLMRLEVMRRMGVRNRQDTPAEFSVDAVMFDTDKSGEDIRRRTDPLYKSAAVKGAESVAAELRIEIDFDLLSPEVQQFLTRKRIEIADLIDGPAEDALRAALTDGITAGESVEKIADRVEDVFTAQRSRARAIARTETAQAFNGARFEIMKEAGADKIEWLTARDFRVRDSHERLDGDVVMIGDKFKNGLYYPLDPAGPPEEIVNCRCIALPAA